MKTQDSSLQLGAWQWAGTLSYPQPTAAGSFVGGVLAVWNLGGASAFYVFAGVAVFGVVMVALVPRQSPMTMQPAKHPHHRKLP